MADEPAASFDLADARACVGARLEEYQGGKVGRVRGVLVDSVDGSPTWLIVQLGRIGRHAAVPARFVVGLGDRAWAAYPRGWIRGAAEIDPSLGLIPADERQLAAHYGIPLDSGRLATLADRTDDDFSSIPDA